MRRMSGEVSPVTIAANPRADELRAPFEAHPASFTVGLEEELMLLDAVTLDLAPRGAEVVAALAGDERFRTELPAAQLEIVGAPGATVAEAADALRAGRRALAAALPDGLAVAGAGVHPFTAGDGVLSGGARYEALAREYAGIARRQLVFGLHVHVGVAGADRALAVFNALREELPALAALAAGAPFYEGRDTGLASVRPKLCDLLPRQGVPPALPSWEALAEALSWGRRTRTFDDGQWWWEARLHPTLGTIEVRVCDAQATVGDSAALAAVVQALVATLAARHEAGELPPPAEDWRIAENRWSACRHGARGRWASMRGVGSEATADHLAALLEVLAPAARELGCAAELAGAGDLLERPRAETARAVAVEEGPRALVARLAERFAG